MTLVEEDYSYFGLLTWECRKRDRYPPTTATNPLPLKVSTSG